MYHLYNKPMNNMLKLKRAILTVVLALSLLPLSAQVRTDTVYTFRFVAGKDMFYIPWSGNDKELARLEMYVEQLKGRILAGEIPVWVDGYCISKENEAENLAVARIRSNRVKSELITRQGLTEECFITRNHATEGDFVTVRITVPKEDATAQEDEEARLAAERAEQRREAAEEAERQRLEQERAAREQAERERTASARLAAEQAESVQQSVAAEEPHPVRAADDYTLSLRANLLRWATLTPDLGLEWRITPSVGIAVNGSWTSWSWNGKDRRYALWEVMPEVRYYIGKEKCGYLGAMFKAGEFNYKLSVTGKQGDLMGGGITGGYQLRLSDALSLDFNIAVGCLHADYEKYEVIDGVRVRAGKETKNWWGPVNAGVTLVWKLF